MKYAGLALVSAAVAAMPAFADPPPPPQEPAVHDVVPAPCVTELFTIYFERGISALGDHSEAVLDAVAEQVGHCRYGRVEISGYADAAGPEAVNRRVSNARAHAVLKGLKERGISADTVAVIATGEARAITVRGYAEPLNRKVTVRLVPAEAGNQASL